MTADESGARGQQDARGLGALAHRSYRRGRVRADLDALGNAYGWAAFVQGVGAFIVSATEQDFLRSAVLGLGVPLWLIAMEVRRG